MDKAEEVSQESKSEKPKRIRPAITTEARENQLIALAMNEAERRILDGTASSQLLCHYLKIGTERERLEREKLKKDIELAEAKTEAIHEAQRSQEMYDSFMDALMRYRGDDDDEQ